VDSNLRWALAAGLGSIGGYCLLANWVAVARWAATRRRPRLVPLVGALFCFLGLLVAPVAGTKGWAWAAWALDPGALPGIALAVLRAARLRRTAVGRLASLPCPQCTAPVGRDVALAARVASEEAVRNAVAYAHQHGLTIRTDQRWHLACAACGASLVFEPHRERDLAVDHDLLPRSPPPGPGGLIGGIRLAPGTEERG
jgi:hypothetical protein